MLDLGTPWIVEDRGLVYWSIVNRADDFDHRLLIGDILIPLLILLRVWVILFLDLRHGRLLMAQLL